MALNILVYSDDRNTREQVRLALGKRPDAELPEFSYFECATAPAVVAAMDAHGKGGRRIDLLVLDGEAVPLGGMGLCRQLKEEIYQCPPVLVLIGRPQDAWLATWSHADAAVPAPVDPVALVETACALLRAGQRPSLAS
ncbi:response regulator transcription factor [Streptacidiphilus fuscans]|uniref:Response regulator transcription factor n=1 Tax=Streptacidiphilus fuscans TaxID=2789292 RepID=A0A931BB87_9ACTN|nr:response regulator transcription factor [Streptacidiphilus fuscans]MBF9071063.1 response regulator transcription factor [Streptacidiphilus fuscans]